MAGMDWKAAGGDGGSYPPAVAALPGPPVLWVPGSSLGEGVAGNRR